MCATYVVGPSDEGADVWVLVEPNDGGWGADAELDGESGMISSVDGDTYNFPVEVIESRFPLRVDRYSLAVEEGSGAGRRRGGFGLVRDYRILDDRGAVSFGSMGGWRRRPWGLAGGGEGTNNAIEYLHADGTRSRHGRVKRDVVAGDVVRIVTGGGGGYGDPLEREPERVAGDVLDGYVTAAQAERGLRRRARSPDRHGRRARPPRIAGRDEPAHRHRRRRHVHRPGRVRRAHRRADLVEGLDHPERDLRGRARVGRGGRGGPRRGVVLRPRLHGRHQRDHRAQGRAHRARDDRAASATSSSSAAATGPDMYNLRSHKPEPFVPRRLCFEVPERVDREGEVLEPLDVDALDAVADRCAELEVEAIAVCFLHSYANPDHERAAKARLPERLPGVAVTASGDVTRQMREYERSSTTILNAYVQPVLDRYLTEVQDGRRGARAHRAPPTRCSPTAAPRRSTAPGARRSTSSSPGRPPASWARRGSASRSASATSSTSTSAARPPSAR